MTSPTRRTLLLRCLPAAGIATLLPAAAHAGYNIWSGEYTVDLPELQAQVETRFPMGMSYAQVFDVQVSRPRLGLNASANRAALTVDVAMRSPFAPQPLAGVLTISGGLRFDAATLSVRLVDPNADRIDLKGLSAADAQQFQAIGQVVAQEALRDFPLHTFKPEDLRRGNRVFEPGEITVVEGGIKVKLD